MIRSLKGMSTALLLLPVFGGATAAKADSGVLQAESHSAKAPAIDITLATPSDIMQGQAIVLRYAIRNSSPRRLIGIQQDPYFNHWYTLTLTDADGKSATPVPDARPPHPAGAYPLPDGTIRPNATRESDIVVNRCFSAAHPGKYTLTVSVNMPYVDLGEISYVPDDLESQVKTTRTFLKKSYTFSLNVQPADPGRMHHIASSLQQKYLGESDPARRQFFMDQLFAMPEDNAAISWRALAMDSTLPDRFEIAKALCLTQSKTAADILVQMEYEMPVKTTLGQAVSLLPLIQQMSKQGDAELKQFIDQRLARHGMSVARIPAVVD